MSAESHKDFSIITTPDINEASKQSPSNVEKNYLKTEEKLIVPLNHTEEIADNQTRVKSRKKRRPKQIIIIETPVPETKKKMKKVHIKYKNQPKIVAQQIKPEIPVTHGQKTLSLIRSTPKYRPVVLAQPQPIILTRVAVPFIKVPIYGQNTRMGAPNFQNQNNFRPVAPNQAYNMPQNSIQNPRPVHPLGLGITPQRNNGPFINPNPGLIQQKNGQITNAGPGPGFNNFNNLNGPNGPYGPNGYYGPNGQYGQRTNKKNFEQDESDRGPSPILLFHDKEDDEQTKKGGNAKSNNGESLNDDSQATTTSRQGAKSKFGRNKLNFISNLFDGYYYTNIDYGEDGSAVDNSLIEKIQPLEKSENMKFNSNPNLDNQSSARFSNGFTNSSSLPPINKNPDSLASRKPFSGMQKFASGQIYPQMDKMTESVNYNSAESLPRLSPRSKNEDLNEARVKSSLKTANSKKSNESDKKRLNYPRNTVLANY
ncbi:hypothetical protein BpHYR1_034926 [Brachionus plicatilis]|uniref:Uncharacterized protein n=1 Tax=Brachionus plicatilis TaxID=10195 RepID=A0A3M7S3W2_BRAPC|nr:hypothetical protein BpHYR1_034926 [Brachionus plicatilis]